MQVQLSGQLSTRILVMSPACLPLPMASFAHMSLLGGQQTNIKSCAGHQGTGFVAESWAGHAAGTSLATQAWGALAHLRFEPLYCLALLSSTHRRPQILRWQEGAKTAELSTPGECTTSRQLYTYRLLESAARPCRAAAECRPVLVFPIPSVPIHLGQALR